jgi:VWFA-related protein
MKWIRAVLALALATSAFAQARETVNVHVVELPVNVIDASGTPIRGLTAANFEILDDGVKRPISSFDSIDFASPDSVNKTSPLNPAARRSYLILFDLAYSSPNALARSQDAARRFVKEVAQPRDAVAVATIDVDRGFHLLTAFTTDRELTASAISNPVAFRGTDPLQIANTSSYAHIEAMSNSSESAVDPAVIGDHMKNMVELSKKANEEYVRSRIEKQIQSLGDLARVLRAVAGRKQIVFLSEGFDPTMIVGRDARAIADEQQELAQSASGAVWRIDSDARFGNSASQTLLDRMAKTFRGSDVVLNAIDIQGVRVQNDVQEGGRITSNRGLYALARPTGGTVMENSNDLKKNFEMLLRQQEVVYVLSFAAPSRKPGVFHELRVNLVGVPAGARLSHRAGYYEAGAETKEERVLTNAEIVVNDIPQSDVRVDAIAAAFPHSGGRAQVPIILQIDGDDLLKGFSGTSLPVEIFVYAFDSAGTIRDRLYQRMTLDTPKVSTRLREGGLKYYSALDLPPGTYAVKSLIRVADADRRGFARVDVTVPGADQVAVTALVPVDEHPRALLVKGNPSTPAAEYPFEVSGQQFIPGVVARASAGPQKMALFVRGLSPDDVTIETNPATTYARTVATNDGSVVVMQIDPAAAKSVDVTVKRRGEPDLKARMPVAQ